MAKSGVNLPPGFELIEKPTSKSLPEGFELLESSSPPPKSFLEDLELFNPPDFIKNEIEALKENYLSPFQNPRATLFGALRGFGNFAQNTSAGMSAPYQIPSEKKSEVMPGETPEEKRVRENAEVGAEAFGALLLRFPPLLDRLLKFLFAPKLQKIISKPKYWEKVQKSYKAAEDAKAAKAAKKFKRAQESTKNFYERKAIMEENPKSDFIEKLFPSSKVSPSKSPFEAAEEVLKEEGENFPKVLNKNLGIEVGLGPTKAKPLTGRVSEFPSAGSSISKLEFETSARGGKGFSQLAKETASHDRKIVSKAYNTAEEAHKNISSIYPKLVHQLQGTVDRLSISLKPNTAESQIITTLKGLLKELGSSERGYIEVPVQRILKASDSISGMANYELPFTGPKNILKKVSKDLNEAAIESIKQKGGNPRLIEKADRLHENWAEKFSNDEILPFLKRKIRDPENLYKKIVNDPSVFRALGDALKGTKQYKEFMNAAARDIAEKRMGAYMKDLTKVGSRSYLKDLKELRDLIGPKNASSFDKTLRANKKRSFKNLLPSQQFSPRGKIPESQSLKKYLGKTNRTPEELLKKMDSRSGIRELKSQLKKSDFEKIAEAKGMDILRAGKVDSNPTGKELFDVMNKRKNYEFFSEVIGKKETDELLQIFKELENNENIFSHMISILKPLGIRGSKTYIGWRFLKSLLSRLK